MDTTKSKIYLPKIQNIQKLNEIEENLENIKKLLNHSDKTYFIEFVGTPKSGKTTLLDNFKNLFNNENIPLVPRQETAEYNPIDKSSKFYGSWMIFKLFETLSEDISCNKGKVVIYDRGILDRLPWINKSNKEGRMPDEDFQSYKSLYNLSLSKDYKPILYNFITSPKLSIQRKGKPGRSVNINSLKLFNDCLSDCRSFFKDHSSIYREFITDNYQDDLQNFIIDVTHSVTQDLYKVLSQDKNINVGRDGE